MSRLRWPDSTNSVSDVPGTIQFDVVLCNGVLHHTSDPYGGYRGIARLVKPGGLIVVGLYIQILNVVSWVFMK